MDSKGTETPLQQAKSPYIHPNDINLDIQHTQVSKNYGHTPTENSKL